MKTQTALMEILRDKIDLRTEWGKDALQTIGQYYERNAGSKLSLLKSLVTYLGDKPLVDILNVQPVDYQTNVKAQCICGKNLSKELYRMRLKGHSTKQSPAYQINEKIKAKTPFKKRIEEFILGSECYKNLPELLNDFGFHELKRNIRKSRRKNYNAVKKIVSDFSPELKNLLQKRGIDAEQLAQISLLAKNLDLNGLEEKMLYDLDPGKRNSFANWFREGIENKTIENNEIVRIYNALANAPNLLKETDLAKLVAYQYEFRKHDTRAVLGNIKKDLLYLDSLDENDKIILKYGKPNLDKRFVRPATTFRKREDLENLTIREKLSQEYMTFIEALGIKNSFPEIEKIRGDVNRETADKYEVGIAWNYILEKLKPIFNETKKGLHEEYKKFGEILKEYALTKEDYLILKGFFKRSNIKQNERQSYLAFYSIPRFREIAPKIVTIGRKTKLSEKFGKEILRKNFFLREDAEENFKKITGIDGSLEEAIDMIENSYCKNKNYKNFKSRHFENVKALYSEGLIEKSLLRNGMQRWYGILKGKVEKFDDETIQKTEYIKSLAEKGLVKPNNQAEYLLNSRYAPEAGRKFINKLAEKLKNEIGEAAKDCKGDLKKIKKCSKYSTAVELYNNHVMIDNMYMLTPVVNEKEFYAKYYRPDNIAKMVNYADNYIRASKKNLDKIKMTLENNELKTFSSVSAHFALSSNDVLLEKSFAEKLRGKAF